VERNKRNVGGIPIRDIGWERKEKGGKGNPLSQALRGARPDDERPAPRDPEPPRGGWEARDELLQDDSALVLRQPIEEEEDDGAEDFFESPPRQPRQAPKRHAAPAVTPEAAERSDPPPAEARRGGGKASARADASALLSRLGFSDTPAETGADPSPQGQRPAVRQDARQEPRQEEQPSARPAQRSEPRIRRPQVEREAAQREEVEETYDSEAQLPMERPGAAEQARGQALVHGVDSLVRCLVSLSTVFGRPVDEADVRGLVPLSAGGMTTQQFCRAAQRLGFQVRRLKREETPDLAELPAPFLLLGRKAHQARVALGHEEEDLTLYDGALGRTVVLPAASAAAGVQEVILLKPPGADTTQTRAREEKVQNSWWQLASKKVRGVIWEIVLASSAINLLALAMPFFAMTIFNKVVGQEALDTLTVLAIGMFLVFAFEGALRVLRGYVSSHTGARVDALIGSEVMHHFLRIPYRDFEAQSAGTMVERVRQLDTIRSFFTGQMPIHIVDLGFTVLFLLVLLFIQPLLAYIVMAAAPILIGITALLHKRQMKLVNETFAAQAAKTSLLNETVNNALTVKSLSLEPEMQRRWEERIAAAAVTNYRTSNLASVSSAAGHILQLVVSVCLLSAGAVLVIQGEMSLGALIAGNMLAARVLQPMRQVAGAWEQVQQTREAFKRINEIMEEPTEAEPGSHTLVPDLRGHIALEAVTYHFDETRPPVLKGIDLEVKRGSMVAVIGPSGSGKSTLAKVMQGLYAPSSGRVVIDGTDVQHMSLPALRQQIGVVPQDSQLFAGTVRDNIAMGGYQRFPERVISVAKFVGAHQFIQKLPNGYETVLSERGVGLSNGQRQLLCIARALIRNPRILILDEATSDLDPVAEDYFLRNLRRAAKGRTVVLITHRLAPISIADEVVLLIDGQVERVGPPKEVVAYAKTRMAEVAGPRNE